MQREKQPGKKLYFSLLSDRGLLVNLKTYGISYIIEDDNKQKTIRRNKGGGSMKQYLSLREAAEKWGVVGTEDQPILR